MCQRVFVKFPNVIEVEGPYTKAISLLKAPTRTFTLLRNYAKWALDTVSRREIGMLTHNWLGRDTYPFMGDFKDLC